MHTRILVGLIGVSLVLAGCGGTTARNDVSEDSADATAEVVESSASEITSTSVEPDRSTTTAAATATSVDEAMGDGEDDVDDEASRDDARNADSTPETVPTTEPGDGVTGEVPEAYLDAVLVDASNTTGMTIAELTVLRAEYVEWSDGSLGCPEPGVVYTQATTPGYWVEIGAGQLVLDYRLGENGFFKVCGGTATPHNTGSTQPGGDS